MQLRRTFLAFTILALLGACSKSDKEPRTDLADPAKVTAHLGGHWLLVQRQDIRGLHKETKEIAKEDAVVYRFVEGTLYIDRLTNGGNPPPSYPSRYAVVGAEVVNVADRADQSPRHWFYVLSIDGNQLRLETSEEDRLDITAKSVLVFNRLTPETETQAQDEADAAREAKRAEREASEPAPPVGPPPVVEALAPVPTDTITKPLEFLNSAELIKKAGASSVRKYFSPGTLLKAPKALPIHTKEYERYDKTIVHTVSIGWGAGGKSIAGTPDEVKKASSYCMLGAEAAKTKPPAQLQADTRLQILSTQVGHSVSLESDYFTFSLTLSGSDAVSTLECRIANPEKAPVLTVAKLSGVLGDVLVYQAPAVEIAPEVWKMYVARQLEVGSVLTFPGEVELGTANYSFAYPSSIFSNGKNYAKLEEAKFPTCKLSFHRTKDKPPASTKIDGQLTVSEIQTSHRTGDYDRGLKLKIKFATNDRVDALECEDYDAAAADSFTMETFLRTMGTFVKIHPVK